MHLYVVNSYESKGNIKQVTELRNQPLVICIEYTSGVAGSRQDITATSPKTTVT